MALRSIIFMRGNRTPPWTSGCQPGRARPGRAGQAAGNVAVLACDAALFLGACFGHFEGSKVSTRNPCNTFYL